MCLCYHMFYTIIHFADYSRCFSFLDFGKVIFGLMQFMFFSEWLCRPATHQWNDINQRCFSNSANSLTPFLVSSSSSAGDRGLLYVDISFTMLLYFIQITKTQYYLPVYHLVEYTKPPLMSALSHWLNQCWLLNEVLLRSAGNNFTTSAQAAILYQAFENYTFKVTAPSPNGPYV